jgi:hypothetical protein
VEHSKQLHPPIDSHDHSEDHSDVLVVYASKGKTFLTALCSFAFAVMMVALPRVLGPDPGGLYSNPALILLAQIVVGAAGGLVTIRMLRILFSPAPRAVVSHEGIRVNSLLIESSIIPWAEIGALVEVGHRLPPVANLLIVLRDRQTLRDRQNGLQALLWRLGGYGLVWPQSVVMAGDIVLPMSAAELMGQICVRFEHELVQHAIQVRRA